eukprot:jgi/Ulvmu1/613/UM001_0621.1
MSCYTANMVPSKDSEHRLSCALPVPIMSPLPHDCPVRSKAALKLETPHSELTSSCNGDNSGKSDASAVGLPVSSSCVPASRSRKPPARLQEYDHEAVAQTAPAAKKAVRAPARRKKKGTKTIVCTCTPESAGQEEIAHARTIVGGSCSRLQPLRQPPTTDASCAPDCDSASDDEDEDTLWTRAKAYNVKRHKAEVATASAVPGVNDPPAMELRAWQSQCTSITGFGLYQRAGSHRSAGGKRKASKPQLDHLKQRISISTQIQVAAAKQERFVVRPSHIAGMGVYAVENIPAKEVLMEYSGVLTRRVHADRLETMYEDMKCDHYLFSIDQSDYIVDATKCGGTCRFVNHSCGPNCEVRTVSVEGVRRILLCSLQEIMAGEELCYDYRLAADPDKAIKCRCGSKRCRSWL